MALSLSMEREKVGGAFRAFQCLGERANEPLWTWLERQAPPVGTPGAEGFDATGLPLVQYYWSEAAGPEPGIYAAHGEDGARLTSFTQSKVSRPPLVSRQRLVYLLSQLSLTDNAFFSPQQRVMLCQEAREVDSHVRRPRNLG